MRNYFTRPRLKATGTINPARFIMQDVAVDFGVKQATAAHVNILGVSSEAGQDPPIPQVSSNPAASTDSPQFDFYRLGENDVPITVAGALAAGTKITSDANGKAVAATTGQMAFGVLLEASSAADQVVRCFLFGCGETQP